LVDDEPLILRAYQRALRSCFVGISSSLAEVVSIVRATTERFDVAVVDLGLAAESGVDVHRWLVRELGVDAPTVLFLTGGSGSLDDETYIAARKIRCLSKPIGVAQLRDAIADAALAREESSALG